ncbi:MAG: phosphate ABC transporter substrate-binding protein [Elusimicrobiota bacterium]
MMKTKKITVCFFLFTLTFGCGKRGGENVSIQIKGSDTEVNLVQRLSEVFMGENPGMAITVTGGGSGTGIAALINQQTDIANSSREMKEEEIKQAKDNAVAPLAVIFAVDGLALIVNEKNQLESLTLEQVAKIFKGETKNWQELGGLKMVISLYGRQSNSGTFVFFRETILKADYSPQMKMMSGNAQIIESVRNDQAAIGYVGIGYTVDKQGKVSPGLKVLKIARDKNSPAVTPLDPENVRKKLYPISRPLYQYLNGQPSGNILKFIQFELGEEGQKIISSEGYYPIGAEYIEENKNRIQNTEVRSQN